MTADALQLITGHITLAGAALIVLGCWFGWSRPPNGARASQISFGQLQPILGIVVAFVGLVLLVFGVVSHPLY